MFYRHGDLLKPIDPPFDAEYVVAHTSDLYILIERYIRLAKNDLIIAYDQRAIYDLRCYRHVFSCIVIVRTVQ
jgi:hypothetical protein